MNRRLRQHQRRRPRVARLPRVVMLLENQPYPQDVRVRAEAETLARSGYDILVAAPRRSGEARAERIAGVRVRRYRLPEASGGVAAFLLEYAVAHAQLLLIGALELARGADVVHLHNPPDTLFPISLLARSLGRAAIFDHHDLFPELIESRFGRTPLVRLARVAQRAALRSATLVLTTNESQRELSIERGGLAATRVVVVRNGPRRETLVDAPAPRPGALDAPRLIYVGELGPQDGVLELPALLEEPALSRARLTIVGDGSCRGALQEDIARRGLADRVSLIGRVPHARVPELLAAADIALDPAPCSPLNQRSTMIKIAEYLAAGLPVVAYALVETRRTAGEAARYSPCGDRSAFARTVAEIAAGETLRAEMAQAARARAESLIWEQSERRLLDAYRLLCIGVPDSSTPLDS